MIPGDLLSAFPHRQFHTLPSLLDSRAALSNSYPNTLRAMQGGSLYHFYDGLRYDSAERRTHDLPCERRTRYRLSQPDTVIKCVMSLFSKTFEKQFLFSMTLPCQAQFSNSDDLKIFCAFYGLVVCAATSRWHHNNCPFYQCTFS